MGQLMEQAGIKGVPLDPTLDPTVMLDVSPTSAEGSANYNQVVQIVDDTKALTQFIKSGGDYGALLKELQTENKKMVITGRVDGLRQAEGMLRGNTNSNNTVFV